MDQDIHNKEKQINGGAKILTFRGRPELDDDKLNWNTLRYVQRIFEHGSFLEASEHLGRSQAHLSVKVAALEKILGYPVFQRSDRGVTLTRKGEGLLRLVTPFLHDLHGFVRTGVGEDGIRTIRIVSTHAIISYILLEPLMEYQEQHPEIRFDLVGDDVHLDLIRHDADIVIRPAMDHAPGITQIPLFTLVKKLYASQSYIDRYGEPKTVEELKHHKLITMSDKIGPHADTQWILKVGAPPGKVRKATHTNNSLECSVSFAKKGFGIFSGYPIMGIIRDSGLLNVLPDVMSSCTLHLLYSNVTSEDVDVVKLVDFMKGYHNSIIAPGSCWPKSEA